MLTVYLNINDYVLYSKANNSHLLRHKAAEFTSRFLGLCLLSINYSTNSNAQLQALRCLGTQIPSILSLPVESQHWLHLAAYSVIRPKFQKPAQSSNSIKTTPANQMRRHPLVKLELCCRLLSKSTPTRVSCPQGCPYEESDLVLAGRALLVGLLGWWLLLGRSLEASLSWGALTRVRRSLQKRRLSVRRSEKFLMRSFMRSF
jgi:hypothetical protein